MASLRSLAATAAFFGSVMAASPQDKRTLPALAQVINQQSSNVLPTVPTPEEYNGSSVSTDHNRPLRSVVTRLTPHSGPLGPRQPHGRRAPREALPRVR